MRQRQLAKQLNINELTALRYIKGYTKIPVEIAEKLAEVLGKDPIWWMKASPAEKRAVMKAAPMPLPDPRTPSGEAPLPEEEEARAEAN